MARDTRLWARFTNEFADHPKIAGLSDAAFRALVEMILYAHRHQTDGVLSASVVERLWKTQSVSESVSESQTQLQTDAVTELLTNDLEKPSLSRNDNGDYVIHGYLDHQESRAEVNARKARNLANAKRGGRPKKTQSVSQSVSESVSQSVSQSVSESVSESVSQSQTQTETRLKIKDKDTSNEVSSFSCTNAEPDSVSRKRSTKEATRLPENWQPTPEALQWAAQELPGFNVLQETPRFIDYWKGIGGQRGRKVDWTATWRNWMRKAAEDRSARAGYRNQAQIHQDMLTQAASATQQMLNTNPLTLLEGNQK